MATDDALYQAKDGGRGRMELHDCFAARRADQRAATNQMLAARFFVQAAAGRLA